MSDTERTIDPAHASALIHTGRGVTVGPWTTVDDIYNYDRRKHEGRYLVLADPDGCHWGLAYGEPLVEDVEPDYPWRRTNQPIPLVRLYPHQVTRTEYRTNPES